MDLRKLSKDQLSELASRVWRKSLPLSGWISNETYYRLKRMEYKLRMAVHGF